MTRSTEIAENAAVEQRVCTFEVKFAKDAPEGTFEGYGAVFGNEDYGGDVIKKGAFAASLREWSAKGKLPKMLLQHGGMWGGVDEMIPIGKWTNMEEDSKGLHCTGRLIALDTDRGKSLYASMKEGELDGLSIGYMAKKYTLGTKPSEPYRTIEACDLKEVSVVLFGMNPKALIDGVKSVDSVRGFERFLHQSGFPKSAAKRLALGGWPAINEDHDDKKGIADFAAMVRSATQHFTR